ncbi:hypothetical protein ACIRPH_31495, partial [Nocardiopsis sp. NPDC101807]|uniref:hypothetical protein n=1 Tax=Nocardiopsis sp. NPDC101807 TaxID=3364339 RepID=UPI00381A8FB2
DAAERYPEQMKAAQARRAARKAGKKAGTPAPSPKATPKSAAPKAGPKPAAPKPAPAPVPAGVVDLDEARRRRAADDTVPEMGPVPDEGNPIMSLNLGDATSLRSHLAALREHASYQDRTCTAKERLSAGMTSAGVGAGTVGAVDASRSASAHAAAMIRAAATALEDANMPVAEARASSPDAGDGDYYERR